MPSFEKIDKRTFIKYAALGCCGLAIASRLPQGLARSVASLHGPGSADDDLWKWSKEAMHYIKTPRGIKCKLCPQACDIADGETGDCRTRVNSEGKLYSISYGNPCAVHVDPIEKKPLYHFLPSSKAFSIATAGCNLACLNCQNWSISQVSPLDTRNYDLMPEKVVSDCKSYKCSSIAYTYTDPVAFYEYTYDSARLARAQGIRNVFISAGYINEKPLREICQVLDAANIDLKSFSNETYEMLNAGTLEPILKSLKIFHEEGVWLEITNLLVPEWTDDFDMIKKMCDWLYDNGLYNCPLHFSRFHPQYKLTKLPPTPYTTLEKARAIAMESGMNYVYIGNVPGTDAENTYCPGCNEIVIERKGFRIGKNNLDHGKCGNCGEEIAGVWE